MLFPLFSHLPPELAPYRSHAIMLAMILGFACAHSGLAYLRPWGEAWLGSRLYRLLFALVSLSLALLLLIYFFNHRYDGVILWDLHAVPGIHTTVVLLSALSFFFLYPATFNLLEIAAIQKPEIHLFETGIIRITRHPQMVGQVIWCVAHSLWIGSSFMLVTSLGLVAYHLFAVWHGDHRLERKYGQAFRDLKARTSVIPGLAILQRRQHLQPREFLRWAYLGVFSFVVILYAFHPQMVSAASQIAW
ncbi:NnrU family protein [Synechococcus sp. H55.10]|uniref:NnrU family protein n=1 Tax=Synechococcus sp. H55.10 TaxID=2964503 RepID=UPI0039C6A9F6